MDNWDMIHFGPNAGHSWYQVEGGAMKIRVSAPCGGMLEAIASPAMIHELETMPLSDIDQKFMPEVAAGLIMDGELKFEAVKP